MRIDPYIIDTLMRDLVAHSRSAAVFLIYLQLYRLSHGAGRDSVAISHSVLAELAGLSRAFSPLGPKHRVECPAHQCQGNLRVRSGNYAACTVRRFRSWKDCLDCGQWGGRHGDRNHSRFEVCRGHRAIQQQRIGLRRQGRPVGWYVAFAFVWRRCCYIAVAVHPQMYDSLECNSQT